MKKVLFTLILGFSFLFGQNSIVVFQTNQGDIVLEIRGDLAPLASENFLTHVKNGYYDGTTFHRVIKNFMIQGGDPTATGRGGESIWGEPFKDEFTPKAIFDKSGILAMANAGPSTNGSQFFITTVPTPWLNGYHTIFGYVIGGMDVVKKIENVRTSGRNSGDKPIETQKIIKAYIKE